MGMFKAHLTIVGVLIGAAAYELYHRKAKGA